MRTFDLAPLYASNRRLRPAVLDDDGFGSPPQATPPYNIERTGENDYASPSRSPALRERAFRSKRKKTRDIGKKRRRAAICMMSAVALLP